ncbi:hypothetical protein EK0264_07555 [Epidermidibacterium keratini]|uniref:Uncharacterized protein n=1 Tax=Epidermidibacterium keratini TaxID=1891644 RepID=A0A7L4YM64_9ACTN|nr:hypothetical protein [Epidermidibacterium keratini]QHC00142.1 hypothetical protein EK0264_07555 [Epidermidibacterium keratini]
MNADYRTAFAFFLGVLSVAFLILGFATVGTPVEPGYYFAPNFMLAGLIGVLLTFHALATQVPVKVRREIVNLDYEPDEDDDETEDEDYR